MSVSSCRADDPAEAAPDLSAEERKSTADQNIRLNYLRAPWPRVLNNLAKATDSTLIMHDVPPGLYSRRDWQRYTADDAIRIVNEALGRKGYRILVKDNFLTVISVQQTRQRYDRPVISSRLNDAQKETQQEPLRQVRVTPKLQQVAPPPQPMQAVQPVKQTGTAIQQSEWETAPHDLQVEPPRNATPSSEVKQLFLSEKSADFFRKQSVRTYEVQQLSTKLLAQKIYRVFQSRAELIDKGPQGLPAIQVSESIALRQSTMQRQTPTLKRNLFRMGVDTRSNQLVFDGAEQTVEQLQLLAEQLDHSANSNSKIKLLSGDDQTIQLVRQLQPALSRIRQLNRDPHRRQSSERKPRSQQKVAHLLGLDDENGVENSPTVPEPNDPPQNNPQAGTKTNGGQMRTPLPALLSGLKGDVRIEALEDLDLLILRGNEKDVEAVMNVIRAIEQLSVGTTPEIHLLKLRHINSEALAGLLNDVYEKLSTQRTNNAQPVRAVNVIPVVTPNAVLILAPSNAMDSILKLAEELDQPIRPGSEVEVFYLRSAIASEAATVLENFYEERVGLGTRLHVIADVRTNALVVQARPRDLSEIARLIRKMDRDKGKAISQLKIYPLKHAVAEELAEFLNETISNIISPAARTGGTATAGGNQAAQQIQTPKSLALELLTHDKDAQKLIRSGLLSDIRITANVRTNSLAVSAPKISHDLLGELILILDKPSSTVAEIKIFNLKFADAAAAVELLNNLFNTDEAAENQLGVQLAGAEDASSNLVPLRFSVDGRTNSVIAIGGGESLRIVEAILLRLDESDQRDRQTTVLKLRNSPAADVATAINEFLSAQRELAQIDPSRVSTSQILNQEIIVTPEAVSNSLLISATPRYYEEILRIAKDLDKAPAQVIIQALIVEVALENTDEFGVELGFQDSILFDRNLIDDIVTVTESLSDPGTGIVTTTQRILSTTATPGFNFNNQPLANNPMNPSSVGAQGLSNFALGRVNGDLGFGGLVLSASSDEVSVLIRALAARRNLRILSRPQILALDNQIAQIQVGQQVPVVDGVNITATGVANPNIRQDESGIILTVTPRISPEGQIVMETVAEKSQFTTDGVPIFTDATTGNVITSPIKDITTARTTVSVPDGQTIVVGGMITESDDTIERKVPWLGDIPVIGKAFRFDSFNSRRTELLIFLTPRIIHNDADAELVKQVETQRIQFFVDEAEEMHGPIFSIPAEGQMPVSPGGIAPDPIKQMPDQPMQQYPLQKMPIPPLPSEGASSHNPSRSQPPVSPQHNTSKPPPAPAIEVPTTKVPGNMLLIPSQPISDELQNTIRERSR